MKTFWFIAIFTCFWQHLNAQDLPGPTANVQSMPEDSYIIAMDNSWQSTSGASPYFNLKAYGLVVYLMNNNIKVKRIIRSGKVKDAVDFSVGTRQVKPTLESGTTYRDFKSGPFVVFGSDVLRSNLEQLVDNYNHNAGGISGITSADERVKVYKTTAAASVDVRYDLTDYKVKAAILTDGGNAPVHTTYMTLAGIPSSNYSLQANNDLDLACFTFASEPHNDHQVPSVVANIKSFIQSGGNFLAQCAAIPNYDFLGNFHSSNGITVKNITPASVFYPNADLSMAQFEGGFSMRQGGSCQNWNLASGSYTNHMHAYTVNTNGFVNNATLIGSAGAKLTAPGVPGGMVYYLGNHSYTLPNNVNHNAGMRMFLNTLLTPANCQQILRYSIVPNCNAGSMGVKGLNGPPTAYPITFYLYADVGSVPGAVDPGDSFIGATTVYNAGQLAQIQMMQPYNNSTDYVVKVVPSNSCYVPEELQPPNCKIITLPASIKNFSAVRNDAKVFLTWQSLAEEESKGYYVQQLVNGHWKDLEFIPSKAQNGSSHETLSYQFVHDNAGAGEQQYRLKLVSFQNSDHLSEIRFVAAISSQQVFSVSKRNASGNYQISFFGPSTHQLSVYDAAGKLIRNMQDIRQSSLQIEIPQKGIYFIKVVNHLGQVQQEKILSL